jgi:hypothetical protein
MSQAYIASFQVWENYGAHDWSGEGPCPQHWKAKGRHEVIMEGNRDFSNFPENNHYWRYDLQTIQCYYLEEEYHYIKTILSSAVYVEDLEYYKHTYKSEIIFQMVVDKMVGDGKIVLTKIDAYTTKWRLV